jgi:Secretory lipase
MRVVLDFRHSMLSATTMLARNILALVLIALVPISLVTAIPAAHAAPLAAPLGTPLPPAHDPFYTYRGSTPLNQITPGTVLKERPVRASFLATAEQVLYRTTGERGQPTVTVATILRPLLPLSGAKIVSYQSAYDALGPQCDPSYTLRGGNPNDGAAQLEAVMIAIYLAAGYTVTVPDYEGTRLDWGAGQESGYGTLDGIRATENYLGLPSSTPAAMVGYSGGSIATEWASELAPGYAPDLHIVAAAAGGVPADFAHNLSYVDGSNDWAGVIPAMLVSLGRAFGVDIDRYLSAYGKQVTSTIAGECIDSFAGAFPGLTVRQLLRPRYPSVARIPALTRILSEQIMGTSGLPAEPLLLAVGTGDTTGDTTGEVTGDGIMVAGDVAALAARYCREGVPVTFKEYRGLDHFEAAVPFEVDAFMFLAGRFLGLPASSECSAG